jgi:hypothetical protein
MIRWRRLVQDEERRLDIFEAMTHVAMGDLPLCKSAHRCILQQSLRDRDPHRYARANPNGAGP